jgi:multiple sugar transport system substrate-binding protein
MAVAKLEAANPGVKVDKIQAEGSANTKLATMIAGGNPPDVAWHGGAYPNWAATGALVPLDEYIAKDKDVKAADFYPTLWENGKFDGKVMAMPYMTQTYVVHYNKDALKSAGIAEPKEGWTWDDVVTAGKALTRGSQWGCRFDDRSRNFLLYGGRSTPDLSRITVNNPTNVAMIQTLRDLWERHGVAPPAEARGGSIEQSFHDGRAAMIMLHSIQLRATRKITSFAWDVAPMPFLQPPGGTRARKTGLELEYFALTNGTKVPDHAWALTKSLTGAEMVGWSAQNGFGIPARKAVAESKAFIDPSQPPANVKVFVDAFGYAEPIFWRHAANSALGTAVDTALGEFFKPANTKNARETLDDLARELETILAQSARK